MQRAFLVVMLASCDGARGEPGEVLDPGELEALEDPSGRALASLPVQEHGVTRRGDLREVVEHSAPP